MENEVMRLAGARKKGLLQLIFSRFFAFVVLLVLQIMLIIRFYAWLKQLLPYYTVISTAFTFCGVVYLFNCRMGFSSKLTWMFIISLLPISGVALLIFTKTNIGHRRIRKRAKELITETSDAIPQSESVLQELSQDAFATDDLGRYLRRSGCFPVYDGTKVTYYPLGEYMFDAMLEELKKAEKFIFMEYFIIEEGYMWGSILKILADKAAAGVDVRVMYDGMLEVSTLPFNYRRLLKEHGIRAKVFSPIRPVISSHYNYRDHRKIMVIDGNVAFTGGVNLADEYINRKERFGHWKDTGIKLKGEAVRSFTLLFLQMWNLDEEEPAFEPWVSSGPSVREPSDGYVIPYGDCPLDGDRVGEMVYIDIFYRATTYVHVMTPYLILDGELENAVRYAAERGVDVKLIMPGIPDKRFAYALAKSNYRQLMEAGVKIYEYDPGFVHAKVFVSDDCKAVVGTINMDYRSLYHHYECAAYLYKTSCISEIEQDFEETLTKCREVTPESNERAKIYNKTIGRLMRLIAPMM